MWNKIKYVLGGIAAVGLVIIGYVIKSNKIEELKQKLRNEKVKAGAKKYDDEIKDIDRDTYIKKEIEKGKTPDEAAEFWNERLK